MSDEWTTFRLTEDLRQTMHLRQYVTATELVLSCDQRADLVCIGRGLANIGRAPWIYEVKISRQDFLADLRAGKAAGYSRHGRVAYAAPAKLIDLREVPADIGLIVRNDRGWRWARLPARRDGPPSSLLLHRFLLRATDDARAGLPPAAATADDERRAASRRRARELGALAAMARIYGLTDDQLSAVWEYARDKFLAGEYGVQQLNV